jgi:hypothetical protein
MYGNEHVTQAIQMERGYKEHPANSAARVTGPFFAPLVSFREDDRFRSALGQVWRTGCVQQKCGGRLHLQLRRERQVKCA